MSALVWGLRASLLRYVSSVGGTVSRAAPATWADERFVFPFDRPVEDETGRSAFLFSGEVALRAYDGLLDVQIADPVLQLAGDDGVLSASTLDRSRHYGLALLKRRSSASGVVEFDAVLHEDAVPLFGGVYERGTALDPVLLSATG